MERIKMKHGKEDIRVTLSKHSLQLIARAIKDRELESHVGQFSVLTDMYYTTRYPGEEFHDCTEFEANLGLDTLGYVRYRFHKVYSLEEKNKVNTTKEFN